MPEGDTVWRAARDQHAALAERTLIATDFRVPSAATLNLAGETVREVVARGKHLLHRIGDWTVHSHLRMEGSWRVFRAVGTAGGTHGGRPAYARWTQPAHTARAILTTAELQSVGFRLGILEVIPTRDEGAVLGRLGPDLLGPGWDPDEAVRRLAADPEVPIFVALLDQTKLSGIGNIYANELCFLRGLAPDRPVGEVDDLPGVVALAHRLLVANRDRSTRTTTGDLRPGRTTWVYGRGRELCRRCGRPLRSGELGARAGEERQVSWCAHCQR